MPKVKVINVTKTFGPTVAVDHITFTAEAGELLTLLGPSGCGKSTTLRLIAGLEEPETGEISVGDRFLASAEAKIFTAPEKRGMGMVFQSYAVWPHMTVFENVSYPLKLRSFSKEAIKVKVKYALEQVGLSGLEDRPGTLLSGGQQQRVALARALVFEPEILLLDEPLSNLDAKLREQMRIELKALQQRIGVTTIYVTHDQAEAMVLSDRIVVMNAGRIEQLGSPNQIYESPKTKFVVDFIGKVNYVAGKVLEVVRGRCVVRTIRGGEVSFECEAIEGIGTGDSVLATIRPKDITLHQAVPKQETNVWRCNVKTAAYYGDHMEYQLILGTQIIEASSPSLRLKPGDAAFVELDADAIMLWRA